MVCANPECRRDAHDLQNGTLQLMEMDVPPEERLEGNDYGFPVCKVPSKFFWLCATCSRILRMKGWTGTGLILEPSPPHQTEKPKEANDLGAFTLQTLA